MPICRSSAPTRRGTGSHHWSSLRSRAVSSADTGLTGADAECFSVQIVDENGNVIVPDDRYPVYYHLSLTIARPLPAGAYRFNRHDQRFSWIPCDYTVLPRSWEITAVPPNGTVHEAFFDPVESVGTAGASETIGVLMPRVFDVEGVETTLASLKWETGIVTLRWTQKTGQVAK